MVTNSNHIHLCRLVKRRIEQVILYIAFFEQIKHNIDRSEAPQLKQFCEVENCLPFIKANGLESFQSWGPDPQMEESGHAYVLHNESK